MTTALRPDVNLEPRTIAHAEELFPIFAEAELYRFIDGAPPATVEDLRSFLARSESRKSPDGSEHWLNWVVRNSTGEVVGYVQATVAADLETNIAYTIGSKFWGNGFALQAVTLMLEKVATEYQVKQFFVVAEKQNLRSVRLAEKLGFLLASPEQCRRKGVSESELFLQKLLP